MGQTDRAWLLRAHKKWQPSPALRLSIPGRAPPDAKAEAKAEAAARRALAAGVAMPSRLVPVFIAFFLDAVGTGLASPILPFYIMGLGANAFQLGLVLAFNYAAQVLWGWGWVLGCRMERGMWIGSLHPCLANVFSLARTTNYSYIIPHTYTHNPPTPVQTVGCIVMGNISDRYGRRPVMLCCLAASFCSLSVVARARALPQVINQGRIDVWMVVRVDY